MGIITVHNEEDYYKALDEIELLWDSPIGSPESDKMDMLVTLVEAYEEERYPRPVDDDPIGVIEY